MSQPKMPFIFARIANQDGIQRGDTPEIKDWMVKITSFHDLVLYDARWADDPELGDYALTLDVDICESSHIFPSFEEARAFVKAWWLNN